MTFTHLFFVAVACGIAYMALAIVIGIRAILLNRAELYHLRKDGFEIQKARVQDLLDEGRKQ